MKNKEKYREEILNYEGESFCSDFIKQNILKPLGIKCKEISCGQCHLICSMWMEEECKEPEVDWSKVPVDTPIFVRDSEGLGWHKRHFAKYENGKVSTWSGGQTSWTSRDVNTIVWQYAKLADVKEEGK